MDFKSNNVTSQSRRIVINFDNNLVYLMPTIYDSLNEHQFCSQIDEIMKHYLAEATRLRKYTNEPEIRKIVAENLQERIHNSSSLAFKGRIGVQGANFYNLEKSKETCKVIHDLFITGFVTVR